MRVTAAATCLLVAGLLAACASAPPVGRPGLLDFLMVGTTSVNEVERQFGSASASFPGANDGRLMTYRIGKGSDGLFVDYDRLKGWENAAYSLVLSFDARGILTRLALVPVRNPQ